MDQRWMCGRVSGYSRSLCMSYVCTAYGVCMVKLTDTAGTGIQTTDYRLQRYCSTVPRSHVHTHMNMNTHYLQYSHYTQICHTLLSNCTLPYSTLPYSALLPPSFPPTTYPPSPTLLLSLSASLSASRPHPRASLLLLY